MVSWEDGFDFPCDEETALVRETARQFSEREVAPIAAKIDREHYFPAELIPKLGELGFLGACLSQQYGGSELSQKAYCFIIEELAAACASTSIIVSAHNSLCISPIEAFGSEDQKKKYLPALAAGTSLGCFALSEPGTGSDAAAQTCRARRDGSGYVVSGTKNWITNGPEADVCVLFTMLDPEAGHKGVCAFVHDMDMSGVSRGKPEEKLGICGSPTCSIHYDEVRFDQSHRLGKEEDGFGIAMKTLDGGRTGVAAQAVGIARAALKAALRYSQERHTFGRPIAEHQSIQNYLADMITRVDAARYLTQAAAERKDRGLRYTRQAAMAKLYASESARFVVNTALQIHGGYGFVKEYPVERHLRDAKITEIYEGTSEIQRLVIAARLLAEQGEQK